MLAKYTSPGQSMAYTPVSAVDTGDVVVVGDTVAVAVRPIAADELGTLAIKGVFTFPKATTSVSAIGAGVKVYWDASGEVITTTAGSNKVAGYTVAATGAADATVEVDLARA